MGWAAAFDMFLEAAAAPLPDAVKTFLGTAEWAAWFKNR